MLAKDEVAHAWAPAGVAHHEEAAIFVQETQPRFKPDEMIYTDGSKKQVPNAGLVTGAGVYTAH